MAFGKTGNFGAICDHGLEPSFGARVRGSRWGSDSTHDDTVCLRMLFGLMDSVRPRLVLMNLACVDGAGHTGIYADYIAAIRVADSVVYELYKRIQAIPPYEDTSYRDRTLYIVTTDHGRNDDVISSSGYRIGPVEVESALLTHPSVAEAAAIAAPDPERGSVVKAVVVLRHGRPATRAEAEQLTTAIQAHCREVTAPYKYPRLVEFVDELPKTASGKIRRGELRDAQD